MTAAEFKAWLDGFMENRGGRLTQKDIKRIQAQAGSVLGGGCGCYHPYPYYPWTYTTTPTIFTTSGTANNQDSTTYTAPSTSVLTANSLGNAMAPWGNGLDTTSMCSG